MSTIIPPPLKNDCFALPPGVDWTPVGEAKMLLRTALQPVVASGQLISVEDACDRILSEDVVALRCNPPATNSAVDGYGFIGPVGDGSHILDLAKGRAAAGLPFEGVVASDQAVRILTGAILPPGVDTIVLEEDCTIELDRIAFNGPLKAGANARDAGEDVTTNTPIFRAGRRLSPTDLSLLASAGVAEVFVFTRLRIGILSTGDEIREPGQPASDWQIYDANRLMLLAMVRGLGFEAIDLGLVEDTRAAVRNALNRGAVGCDLIITSGGASAGDEDHISAILKSEGELTSWRIALKPGRPLALGVWDKTPVIGLPGNPVAAWVCTLVFGRPAMEVLAGGFWREPRGILLPAAFKKNKRRGRSEYLRARINENGEIEVFPSEGSGRISSISWAEGFVELAFEAELIEPGVLVRYISYEEFLRPSQSTVP
ncbi:molybdopterin-binding protein [Litorivicinus sp.]|jgi:molybdopterin molybdotransferase|nr:molybdopterin-binding protein [Litorivicinus sp.]MDB9862852.1 molybdopterin-binding protein [Litorivicinus sp.]MDC1208507.1 molybdopterin-binding protein [Litorivicinus sp.]MDC1239443.1 molybdopterin-binding protein [Litorivicinus sp.]MDC1319131.1 molybdopterin-binding protein [Litorivicinus sp.]|tara:strand:+ start:6745 stop:8031 length:1287 start_codon:yes stop_codon:yes gene_type:complete